MALSYKVATLHEMQTIYSIEDVYDMLEVVVVDANNRYILEKRAERE